MIKWNETLSVKIDSIDNEHKKLINMINEFYETIETKSNEERISILIKEMKEYTVTHFKTEENYFKKFNYPKAAWHKRQHDEFVEKVIDMEKRFNAGTLVLSFEITKFLKEWLSNHIMVADKRYTNFLIENGVR